MVEVGGCERGARRLLLVVERGPVLRGRTSPRGCRGMLRSHVQPQCGELGDRLPTQGHAAHFCLGGRCGSLLEHREERRNRSPWNEKKRTVDRGWTWRWLVVLIKHTSLLSGELA